MAGIMRIISRVGESGIERYRTIHSMAGLLYDALAALVRGRGKRHLSLRQIVDQVLFSGVDAFVIISIIGLLCGIIISIQSMTNMPKIGAGEHFGSIMVIAVIRELGPFFTSLVVIGRSGAALAAYIGNMRVSKEISALESMGIDLIHFLVLPAFIGMIVSLVCLNIYFDLVAIVGGLLVAKIAVAVPFGIFIGKVLEAITMLDIVVSVVKSVVFGATIAVISCWYGLQADNVRMVPRSVFRAVVGSILATLVINVIATIIVYAR
jgi:phospholipid/cholesterol/gamma-HCH transport system permease protein